MTLVVGILFFGLAVMSKADEVKTYKIQDTLNTVGQIPNKLGNHISNEIEEIKVYQKKNWAEGKAQLARTTCSPIITKTPKSLGFWRLTVFYHMLY